MYALPEDRSRLSQATKRYGRLEQHIVENARYLVDRMLRDSQGLWGDPLGNETREARDLIVKCSMLYRSVRMLSDTYRSIPRLPAEIEEDDFNEYLQVWDLPLPTWYQYWIEVLHFFKDI